MTNEEREEAIKELKAFKNKSWDGMPEEVIDVAIEALEQEPFINKHCISGKVCKHDKKIILDKIRADVINIADGKRLMSVRSVVKIIDKYREESEE